MSKVKGAKIYMESKKVSIIVPIYNAQNYINKTIKSLINQTLKEIEIILVNDGSKDESKQICEKYAKEDDRIILINKTNGGIADTRNVGMQIATGKYIMFLDADDLFEMDSCEKMFYAIEKSGADYVIGNYQMMDEDGTKWEKPAFDVKKYQEFQLDKNDYRKSFFVMNSTAWNKIYRSEFLKKNDITFKVPYPSEDDYFTSLCYMKANYAFYIPKVIYLYRNSPNSLSKNCSLQYFQVINDSYKMIYNSFKENDELNYYRYVYAKKNAYLLCQLIDSEQISTEQKIECIKDLEWYFELADKLKINTAHESLKNILSLIKEKDYENLVLEIEKLKKYRKGISDKIKKRMSFPTRENYAQMEKYDKEFIKQGVKIHV